MPSGNLDHVFSTQICMPDDNLILLIFDQYEQLVIGRQSVLWGDQR